MQATEKQVAVAYSGGRDSTALLHATLRAAHGGSLRVHALHVHHGLSVHADDWLTHCEQRCRTWARAGLPVQFHAVRLQLPHDSGHSVEALARTERYAALAQMAHEHGCSLVLLAHHRDDQAETFLLQALRGAGVAGLAAMPRQAQREGLTWARPWLEQPRRAIENYLHRYRLTYVNDDSNADGRFARNRLRLQVWPALVQAFPDAAHVLADAAVHAADAAACLVAQAGLDRAGATGHAGALRVAALQALGPARGRNLLRVWLHERLGRAAPAALVVRLWDELPGSGPARWDCGAGELRRYRGELRWSEAAAVSGTAEAVDVPGTDWPVPGPGRFMLPPPWTGLLEVRGVTSGGVPAALLPRLRLQGRCGGEQFQLATNSLPRALKKQYQAAAVPPWERRGPLLWADGQLLFVPGLGIDARAMARPGELQVMFEWHPDVG